MTDTSRKIKSPQGTQLTCKNWLIEAAYRMLQNNLDPEVAFDPDNLIVYGGRGKAARNWPAFDAILETLRHLEPDETLLVQSGKPVAVFRTHEDAPRVLLANSNIVPKWATQENFDKWEKDGLIMYGQMTAGSWIYIGTQGILQGTYETFGALARQMGWGSLKGKFVLTAGLGEMGGAQPLAITMNEGVGLLVEVDRWRAERRLSMRQLDAISDDLEEAMTWVEEAVKAGQPKSIGLIGNAAEILPELVMRGIIPDVVTDQTSAHDVMYGYIPAGMTLDEATALRQHDPQAYQERAMASMAAHVQAMLDFKARGSVVFDYGNNLRQRAYDHGLTNAFDYPGFVPAYIRPLFCEGKGPFRWVALSGNPEDIYATDRAMMELFPDDEHLNRWLKMAGEQIAFQGLPARICWLGYGERLKAGLRINEMVASGEISAPIVIGRDHLDSGSVASPNRETEAMRDGSDAIADWPLLNALVNAVGGATWVSIHHGGGVGIGYSIHAGQVIVADGTEAAARRLERVLTSDPGMGVVRHADAGYPEAITFAQQHGIKIPMMASISNGSLTMQIDLLITHAAQLVTCASDSPKRGAAMTDVGMIVDGAVAVNDGLIIDVGSSADLQSRYQPSQTIDASEKVICPGFVDAHTHIVYAGDRAAEFELRIKGASYMEIMAAGGGIVSTMRQVREASVERLVAETRSRLDAMLALGTTTVEIKTGYGLDADSELKMLHAIEILDQTHAVDIIPTFLGAHAIPPEYLGRAEAFTQYVIDTLIPAAAAWYRESHFPARNVPFFIDVFCEKNAFDLDQSRRVLDAGVAHGMQVKAHVDEFANLGGAEMAVNMGAVSIDHLDATSPHEIAHLAESDTVAVIIPAVNFNFGSTVFADARGMIDVGAAVALATDYNPGSAPCPSMPLVMAIACRYQHLLPSEALNASTINAAYAVGMGDRLGSIQPGKQADLLIINAPDYRHLAYQFGGNLVEQVIKNGKLV